MVNSTYYLVSKQAKDGIYLLSEPNKILYSSNHFDLKRKCIKNNFFKTEIDESHKHNYVVFLLEKKPGKKYLDILWASTLDESLEAFLSI